MTPSRAVIKNRKLDAISRKVFGLIVLLIVITTALSIGDEEYGFVVIWACGALFSWHLLFTQRQVSIDLVSQQIITTVSSIYPITEQSININQITAFRVDKDSRGGKGYKLMILLGQEAKPFGFQFGSIHSMNAMAKQMSLFCDKPLISSSVI